jgi:hypothetical protein
MKWAAPEEWAAALACDSDPMGDQTTVPTMNAAIPNLPLAATECPTVARRLARILIPVASTSKPSPGLNHNLMLCPPNSIDCRSSSTIAMPIKAIVGKMAAMEANNNANAIVAPPAIRNLKSNPNMPREMTATVANRLR